MGSMHICFVNGRKKLFKEAVNSQRHMMHEMDDINKQQTC